MQTNQSTRAEFMTTAELYEELNGYYESDPAYRLELYNLVQKQRGVEKKYLNVKDILSRFGYECPEHVKTEAEELCYISKFLWDIDIYVYNPSYGLDPHLYLDILLEVKARLDNEYEDRIQEMIEIERDSLQGLITESYDPCAWGLWDEELTLDRLAHN